MTNQLDQDYLKLLEKILRDGQPRQNRTQQQDKFLINQVIDHDMQLGFPLLTTKHVSFKNILTEFLWMVKGRADLKYLLDYNCFIWVGDAYKRYQETASTPRLSREEFIEQVKHNPAFSQTWGWLGYIYGPRYRYNTQSTTNPLKTTDLLAELLQQAKREPFSRRLFLNIWEPGDLSPHLPQTPAVLPPCHFGFHLIITPDPHDLTKPYKVNLIAKLRSTDVPLGLPYNLAFYGLMLSLIAQELTLIPGQLSMQIDDAHIYENQIAGVNAQLKRTPKLLPTLNFIPQPNLWDYKHEHFTLKDYNPHEKILIPLTN